MTEDIVWIRNNLPSEYLAWRRRSRITTKIIAVVVPIIGICLFIVVGLTRERPPWVFMVFMCSLLAGLGIFAHFVGRPPNDPYSIGLSDRGVYLMKPSDHNGEDKKIFVPWEFIGKIYGPDPWFHTYSFLCIKKPSGLKGFGLVSEDCIKQAKEYIRHRGIMLGVGKIEATHRE